MCAALERGKPQPRALAVRQTRRAVIAYAQSPGALDPQPQTGGVSKDSSGIDNAGEQQLAWLINQKRAQQTKGQSHLLILRFALINIVAFALLAAAALQGLVEKVIVSDQTYLTVAIAGVFLAGLAVCTARVWETSRNLDDAKNFDPLRQSRAAEYLALLRGRSGDSRSILAATMRLSLSQRISIVRQTANSLVLLGLIGTVIGFIIALSGVDPDHASDVKAITPMVSTLIQGMSTALYTTLVGAVLNVWLMVNYHLLAGGTVKLISALVELGEDHARA